MIRGVDDGVSDMDCLAEIQHFSKERRRDTSVLGSFGD